MKKTILALAALLFVLPLCLIPTSQAVVKKALIYYGNGGFPPGEIGDPDTYYGLKAFYEAQGWQVDYTDVWTTELWRYRLIILVAPGAQNDDGTFFFTDSQVADLAWFVKKGGHLVVMGEHSGAWGINTQNDLLSRLGVGIAMNPDAATVDGDMVPPLTDLAWDLLNRNVRSLDLSATCSLTLSGNAKSLLWTPEGDTVIAVERNPWWGFVVVTGDTQVFDDYVISDPYGDGTGDWAQFAWNLFVWS